MIMSKKTSKQKKKIPMTKQRRSEIALKAVQARRENDPNWGDKKRAAEQAKKEKLEAKEKPIEATPQ